MEADTTRTTAAPATTSLVYDGFISYSHAADGLLAPRLQAGLQRFAKPWWRRRALRVFRDESSLSANPHLWSSITDALDSSAWFVLLLSPDAAASQWVNQEIEYWKTHRDPSRILPVVTDGEFGWNGDVTGDAVPESLRRVFSEEPRWVDLRFARDEEQLDLKDPRFADAVADIASALRGVPKDELASEEVRQHRRTIRTAWAAGGLMLALAVAATAFGFQSVDNAARAELAAARATEEAERAETEAARAEENAEAEAEARQRADDNAARADEQSLLARSRELAAAAIANLEGSPELSTLLALQALDTSPAGDDPPVELVNAIWQVGSSNRLVDVIETGFDGDVSLSPDGARLATTVAPNRLQFIDTDTHAVVWEYSEETVDHFAFPIVGPDGRIALAVFDSSIEWGGPVEESDDLPNRVVILTSDGEPAATLTFPECGDAGNMDWSADGRFLAVGFLNGCPRNEAPQWIEVFETGTWESVAFLPFEGVTSLGPSPRFDAEGTLYALRTGEQTVIFEAETFEQVEVSEATGIGDVTPDGSRLLGFYTAHGISGRGGTAFSVLTFDRTTGDVADILYNGIRYPSEPFGVAATGDGRTVVVATGGSTTHVYDLLTGDERFRLPTGPVDTFGYDEERQLLYTSGSDDGPRIWDLGSSNAGVTPTGDLGEFSWVNGNSFEVGSRVGAFVQIQLTEDRWQTGLFDLESGEVVGSVPGAAVRAALPDGRFLLDILDKSAPGHAIYDSSTGGMTRFFDCENVDPVEGCRDPGYNIAVSVDGDEILAYPYERDESLAGVVHSLDPATGEILRTDPIDEDELVAATFSDAWVLGHPTTRIDYRAVDRATGEVLWHDELGHIRHEMSPDRRWLATRGVDTVQVVDTRSWEVEFTLGGFDNLRGSAFDADGEVLAMADADSVRLIDIETGLVAQQIRLPGVSDMYFLDDETLLLGTKDGIFGTVSLSTEELVARTRAALRRSFSPSECATYRIDPCPTLDEMRSG